MDQYPSQPSVLPTRPHPLAEPTPTSTKRDQSPQQPPPRPPLKRKAVDELLDNPPSPIHPASAPSTPARDSSPPPSLASASGQATCLEAKSPTPPPCRARRRHNKLALVSPPLADAHRSSKRARHYPPSPPRGPLPPKLGQNAMAATPLPASRLAVPPISAGPTSTVFSVPSTVHSSHPQPSSSPPKPSRSRRRAHSLPVLSPGRVSPTSRQHHTKSALRPLILPHPSASLPAPGSVASLSHLQLLTYHQLQLGPARVALAPPGLNPPITRATLRELDLTEILRNPQLRHDIVFDPNLMFRPNFDGERCVSVPSPFVVFSTGQLTMGPAQW
jgi:hypothetical protein